ncbi:zinc finger CCHC domain-containing protein 18-like [Periophthalmus magnuspinnatus]|uniref:zinc finger CCHC domain-containing protein 18-like n=1 Tax=Periophthalmus magnuspinnatus TaxID=409849 RepID=UPI00243666B5|nr:zinc finger CCHC domain-containing protein 18-like [Periophthalmus magnuspinnatus]
MDILEERGVKIPNAVLVKDITKGTTADEVCTFLAEYGKISKVEFIDKLTPALHHVLIVEYNSGAAVIELRKILPYTHICEITQATHTICDLAAVCAEELSKAQTLTYLSELQKLAKITGKDYATVLTGVMSLLGQSVTGHCSSSGQVKMPPDGESEDTGPSEEHSHHHSDPAAQYTPRPRSAFPAEAAPEFNPPEVQRYVVEHIVKNDDLSLHSSSHRLRAFSGRLPRPQHESDYDTWRSGVDLLLKDSSVSDLQRSRKIFESLLPPAADTVKHLRADTPPVTYLQILDSAYGTVQDGDELHAKFMDTFQDAGEKPSTYLQRLQVALHLTVKRGGVPATETDRFLLNQFCRGCWDNTLISELQLKQRKSNPPTFAEFLLLLRTEEDREAAKALRMKQHLGSAKPRVTTHAQYAYTATEEKVPRDPLTTITQQLTKQLADIQKQLALLTAAQASPRQSTPSKSTHASKPGNPSRNSGPKPGYCFQCGEDGHIKSNCDNDPNPSLVAAKKRQFNQKQQKWQKSSNQSLN